MATREKGRKATKGRSCPAGPGKVTASVRQAEPKQFARDGVVAWLDTVGEKLALAASAKVKNDKDLIEAKSRSKDLSTTSDRDGVSFKGRPFQLLYFDKKFNARALLVFALFEEILAGPPSQARAAFESQLTASGSGKASLDVCCIGGGPGNDAAGLVCLNEHFLGFTNAKAPLASKNAAVRPKAKAGDVFVPQSPLPPRLRITLLDKETQWKAYTKTLSECFEVKGAAVKFAPCDVVAPLPAEASAAEDTSSGDGEGCGNVWGRNATTAAALRVADLHVFCYVVHETSNAAAEAGFPFYKGLAASAKLGSVFAFLDVAAGRSLSAFQSVFEAMTAGAVEASSAGSQERSVTSGGGVTGVAGGGPKSCLTSRAARSRRVMRLPLPTNVGAKLHSEVMLLQITA